jgi:hypothetical protein
VTRGTATASGQDSPGIYSTGSISATGATISATGAEAAVIEGANSITLTNTVLSGAKGTRDRGLMIYQSMSGDAQGTQGTFTMTRGSFTWPSTTGPAFYVTNSTGVITLKTVAVHNNSPTLVKAGADQWGTSGKNGGTVIFTADGDTLTGNLICDNISSISATLKNNSSLTGFIDSAALTIDAGSMWTVTGTSYLTSLSDSGGISGGSITNITGNGNAVYYNSSLAANSGLGGKTYGLLNGGELTPRTTSGVDRSEASIPSVFSLAQNYPNPFNPTTTIRYGLPSRSTVTLGVYDLLGQLIVTLVRETQDAGFHETTFDATGLPSGVYICSLQAGNYMAARKLLLIK